MQRLTGYIYYLLTGIRIVNLEQEHRRTIEGLEKLAQVASEYGNIVLKEWEHEHFNETRDSKDLGDLLTKYGSDKSTRHNYHLLYADLLKRDEPFALLEVGLGRMSEVITGECASLKAFREWAPHARLYGMDVEKRLLFQEERIHTYWADQFDEATISEAAKNIKEPLDLIIDDGLHRPWTNLNTLHALLPLLKDGGHYVIEDIESRFYFYPPIVAALSPTYDCKLIRTKISQICLITKRHTK